MHNYQFLSLVILIISVSKKMSGKDLGYSFARLVRISGEDAVPAEKGNNDKTNFVVDFGSNLQQVKRVSIVNVSFLNNAFNFVAAPPSLANVFFTFELDDGSTVNSTTYTLQEGFYDMDTLLTDLNAAAVDFKTTYANAPTVVFSTPSEGGFIIATIGVTTAGYTLTILDSDANGLPSSKGPISSIGFTTGSIVTSGAANVRRAPDLPSLQGLTEAYVVSQALAPGNCFDEKNQASAILVTVPITAPFGVLNVMECKQDILCEISYVSPKNIQRADFSLRDRFGNLINLHGANLKLTLKVFFNTM